MDETQSRLILDIDINTVSDSDELQDRIEEAIFKEVTFFTRRPFVPILATKCIKNLRNIKLAAEVLGFNFVLSETPKYVDDVLNIQDNLLSVLSVYHSKEAWIKSILVNTISPEQGISLYDDWMSLFETFVRNYIDLFEDLNVDIGLVEPKNVRISEAIDFNELQMELKDLNYTNLACVEYYRLQKLLNITK